MKKFNYLIIAVLLLIIGINIEAENMEAVSSSDITKNLTTLGSKLKQYTSGVTTTEVLPAEYNYRPMITPAPEGSIPNIKPSNVHFNELSGSAISTQYFTAAQAASPIWGKAGNYAVLKKTANASTMYEAEIIFENVGVNKGTMLDLKVHVRSSTSMYIGLEPSNFLSQNNVSLSSNDVVYGAKFTYTFYESGTENEMPINFYWNFGALTYMDGANKFITVHTPFEQIIAPTNTQVKTDGTTSFGSNATAGTSTEVNQMTALFKNSSTMSFFFSSRTSNGIDYFDNKYLVAMPTFNISTKNIDNMQPFQSDGLYPKVRKEVIDLTLDMPALVVSSLVNYDLVVDELADDLVLDLADIKILGYDLIDYTGLFEIVIADSAVVGKKCIRIKVLRSGMSQADKNRIFGHLFHIKIMTKTDLAKGIAGFDDETGSKKYDVKATSYKDTNTLLEDYTKSFTISLPKVQIDINSTEKITGKTVYPTYQVEEFLYKPYEVKPTEVAGLVFDTSDIPLQGVSFNLNMRLKYKDIENPTASSKVTKIALGDVEAILSGNLKTFVNDLKDNISDFENITAVLDDGQDIVRLVETVGEKTIRIKLMDQSGNTSIVTTEVVIYDYKLTVLFLNDLNESIHESVILDKPIGISVNLTKESSVRQVLTKLKKNYTLTESPANELDVVILPDKNIVTYRFEGKLTLLSVPATLDFGVKVVNGNMNIRENAPSYQEPLIVSDTRSQTNKNWTLKATLSKPFTSEDGTVIINDALRYKNSTKQEFSLSEEAQILVANETGTSGVFDISATWGGTKDSNGFKLEMPGIKLTQLGKYSAEITYYLSETYEP